MEKTLDRPGLPKTDSIEELARFWDTHDVTAFAEDLEEVREPVFVQKKNAVLKVTLRPSEAQRVRRIAGSRGDRDSALLRQWIIEKIQGDDSKRPHNTGLQPPASHVRKSPGSRTDSRSRRLKP